MRKAKTKTDKQIRRIINTLDTMKVFMEEMLEGNPSGDWSEVVKKHVADMENDTFDLEDYCSDLEYETQEA